MTSATTDMALPATTEVAVVGVGAMGAGIAQVAAVAGHRTRLYDARAGAAEAAKEKIAAALERIVAKGRMTPAIMQAAVDRLHPIATLADCGGTGLVIEAIVESLDVKRKVLAEIESHVAAACLLASNTSLIC